MKEIKKNAINLKVYDAKSQKCCAEYKDFDIYMYIYYTVLTLCATINIKGYRRILS